MPYKLSAEDNRPLVSTRCDHPCGPVDTCGQGIFVKCQFCHQDAGTPENCDCKCVLATPAHVAEARLRSKTMPLRFENYEWFEDHRCPEEDE